MSATFSAPAREIIAPVLMDAEEFAAMASTHSGAQAMRDNYVDVEKTFTFEGETFFEVTGYFQGTSEVIYFSIPEDQIITVRTY